MADATPFPIFFAKCYPIDKEELFKLSMEKNISELPIRKNGLALNLKWKNECMNFCSCTKLSGLINGIIGHLKSLSIIIKKFE